jgi:hypothetical protein
MPRSTARAEHAELMIPLPPMKRTLTLLRPPASVVNSQASGDGRLRQQQAQLVGDRP